MAFDSYLSRSVRSLPSPLTLGSRGWPTGPTSTAGWPAGHPARVPPTRPGSSDECGSPRTAWRTPGAAPHPPPRARAGELAGRGCWGETELLGRASGSGLREPPYLVCRADGQIVQLSHLLYTITACSDGREIAAIAADAGARLDLHITAAQVACVAEHKLAALGLITQRDGRAATLARRDALLALRYPRRARPRTHRQHARAGAWLAVPGADRDRRARRAARQRHIASSLGAERRRRAHGDRSPRARARAVRAARRPTRSARVRARRRVPLQRRPARCDRRRHLPHLAGLLQRLHRLLPGWAKAAGCGPTSAASTSTRYSRSPAPPLTTPAPTRRCCRSK